jgi:S-adenosylmethionine:tRNA ribosyltransferase-isomerase
MRTDELDYPFDPALVATHPVEPRDAARLMVVDRAREEIGHHHVRDLPDFLAAGDALVLNATHVVPARVVFEREATGGRSEGLVLPEDGSGEIGCYLRGAKRLRAGECLLLRAEGSDQVGRFEVLGRREEQVRLRLLEGGSLHELLDRSGRAPLPPYILGARRERAEFEGEDVDALDRAWYRTVFERDGGQSSVAAPTAGLHFTEDLLDRIAAKGVHRVELELEVGPGTFKPVTADTLEAHPMHSERFVVDADAQALLGRARAEGGRVIAIGTTSCRALESLPKELPGTTVATATDLLISPGHAFRHVDALLTNFHLPRSTLLALVAGLVGLERMQAIYAEAVSERYRFYSYGDAMLIL